MHGYGFALGVVGTLVAAAAFAAARYTRLHPLLVTAFVFILTVILVTAALNFLFGGFFPEVGLAAGALVAFPAILGSVAGKVSKASRELR